MRSEFHFEAFKFLLIESSFLQVAVTGANALRCCISTASEVGNQTILDWRVSNSSSLAEATIFALDSIFERVSDTDPGPSRVGHRYRFGNCEYVVTTVRDDCVWLQRSGSRQRDATKLNSPGYSQSPTASASEPYATHASGCTNVGNARPSKPAETQPVELSAGGHSAPVTLEVVHSNYLWQRLPRRELALKITREIAQWNGPRPSEERLKMRSFATLHRLIRKLRQPSNHSL